MLAFPVQRTASVLSLCVHRAIHTGRTYRQLGEVVVKVDAIIALSGAEEADEGAARVHHAVHEEGIVGGVKCLLQDRAVCPPLVACTWRVSALLS